MTDAAWFEAYRARGARSRGRTRSADEGAYKLLLLNPDLSRRDRVRYSARLAEIRGKTETAERLRARLTQPKEEA